MERGDGGGQWQGQMGGMEAALWAWRQAHPTATFNEIEDAVDQQFGALRAQVLADLSLASRAADVQAKQAGAPPRCPQCGERLRRQGKQRRQVVVHGGHTVALDREYGVCPACGTGLFPPG